MKPQVLFDHLTLAAAVVAGVQREIMFSAEARRAYPYLVDIWQGEGLLNQNFELTSLGREFLDQAAMIGYELVTLPKQAFAPSIKASPGDYDLLRKALGQNAEKIGKKLYAHLDTKALTPVVLDVGGGDGSFLRQFLQYHPFEGVLIDSRQTTPETVLRDVFENPEWPLGVPAAGVILLNEILHLRSRNQRRHLVSQCLGLLDPRGWLIIGERWPTPGFRWRMAAATATGEAIGPDQLIDELGLHGTTLLDAQNQYFIYYRKGA